VQEAFRAMLPFALAGSILPTWTLMVIALLGTSRPAANAWAFIAGNAAWRLGLGVVVLFLIPDVRPPELPMLRRDVEITAYLLVALITGALAAVEWFRKRRPDPGGPAKWMSRFESIRPLSAFATSALFCASPGVQWVYFLGGMTAIRAARLPASQQAALLLVFVLIVEAMLMTPALIYAVSPRTASRSLERFKGFLLRESHRITAVVLGLVALSFVWRAAQLAGWV
jgi:hypothetical protein